MFSYRMCVQTKGRWNDIISQQQFVACEWGGSCNGGIDDRAAKGQAKAWDTVEACPKNWNSLTRKTLAAKSACRVTRLKSTTVRFARMRRRCPRW